MSQDYDDNYLMSANSQQSLSGLYLKPSIQYNHDDGVQKWTANLRESLEQYNRAEYDVENPAYGLSFEQKLQRSVFKVGYDAATQSTRITEFTDAGNFENATTNQQIQTLTASWQYQLNASNAILLSGDLQATDYGSQNYADLKNKGLQAILETSLSEKTSVYAGLQFNEYQSDFSDNVAVAPVLVGNFLVCPTNAVLLSFSACSVSQPRKLVNTTRTPGLLAGLNWSILPQLKFGLGAGFTQVDSELSVSTPQTAVQFGAPIDQEVVFGGQRSSQNQSQLTTLKMDMTYQLETTGIYLGLFRKIQPSSSGSLLQTYQASVAIKKALSAMDGISAALGYQQLVTFNDTSVNGARIDRNIFQSNLNYTHLMSQTWQATSSLGYKKQENRDNNLGSAEALLGSLTLTYTPKEWMW